MDTPPPLPPGETKKSNRRTLVIVLACLGGLLLLSIPVGLAIIIPTVGKVRETARRTVDGTSLRQVLQGSLIWANSHDGELPPVGLAANGVPLATEPATIHAVAAALAREGALNEATLWFASAQQAGDALSRVLSRDHQELDPAFAAQTGFAWDYATGLSLSLPPFTPVAWTRGLREDGSWDPETGVYGNGGGFVGFLGGNVAFYQDLRSAPLYRPDGTPTTNILEALPTGARVVGAGPGTLHGRTGRASGERGR